MPITQVALSNTFNEFRNTVNDIANTVNGVAPVTLGGTGLATLTANSLIVGAGTANVTFISPGTANNVLTSDGTNWSSTTLPAAGLSYVYKTANYTTQNLQGVLANTAAVGAFTVTLPPVAGLSVGSQVVISDAGNFWGTNNLTIGRNGATISDSASDLVCDINGASVQLVYDGTTWEVYAQVGGNGGNVVVGATSATDNAIARYDNTTGRLIQNSLVTVADDGAITAPAAASVIPFYYANQAAFPSASTYHGALAHSHSDGEMYFAHAGAWVKLLKTVFNADVDAGAAIAYSKLSLSNSIVNADISSSAAIANSKLANSAVTIGNTAVSLGSTVTTFAGLTSVTSTSFVGTLTGSATSATSATTAGTVTTSAQPSITSVGSLTGLTVSGDMTVSGNTTHTSTGALKIPSGTTAQNAGFTTVGMIRFDTSTDALQVYKSTGWASAGSSLSSGKVFFFASKGSPSYA